MTGSGRLKKDFSIGKTGDLIHVIDGNIYLAILVGDVITPQRYLGKYEENSGILYFFN
jgi:hypothetical protein